MTNDEKLVEILKAQHMTINYLVDALNKLSSIQGLSWDAEKQDWVRIEARRVVNG